MSIRPMLLQFIAAFMTLLLTVATVSAQDSSAPVLQRIAKTQTLRVGMTGDQPPFNVISREGKIIGMDVDLAHLLAGSMGVQLEIVEMEFSKLLPALEDREIDLVMSGVTITLQRNVRVPFVGPYHVSGISILTKSETLASIQTSEQLNSNKVRIAVLRGSTSENFVEATLAQADLTATVSHADSIRLLLEGKVDVVVADAPICALSILRHPDAGLITLTKPLTIEPIGIAVAPGDPQLVNLIQNYMKALRATGALEGVKAKWFSNGSWLAQLP